jgi:hypothetical protein
MKNNVIRFFVVSIFLPILAYAQTTTDTFSDQVHCAVITHTLKIGSRDVSTDGDVTTLQIYLSQANFLDVDPTGYFGKATKKAVQDFQSANGIAHLGNVGPYTRTKIKELSCTDSNINISSVNISPVVNTNTQVIATPSTTVNTATNQSNYPLCSPTTSKIDNNVFGISVTYRGQNQIPDYLNDLGAKWVRIEFHFGYILQDDGTYNWKDYDKLMEGLYKNNIAILATIDYIPPRLMRGQNEDWSLTYKEYSRFIKALNDRYGVHGSFVKDNNFDNRGIRYYEVFNEPNLPGYGWLVKGNDSSKYIDQYANFLTITNTVLHESNKDTVIVLGGLSRTTYGGMSPENFMNEIYKRGKKNCFDIIGYHPYGLIDELGTLNSTLAKFLVQYHDQNKPIWFDEFGINDETKRQEYLKKVFSMKNKINGFFWFTLIDPSTDGDKFGLIGFDTTKNDSYSLFKELMKTTK